MSVDHPFDQTFIDRMAQGVVILDRPTKPCRIERLGPARFRIILTEGRNRQIRRMCQVVGYRVLTLHRVRIMHMTLDGLVPGAWKQLTVNERKQLFHAVGRDSSQGKVRVARPEANDLGHRTGGGVTGR